MTAPSITTLHVRGRGVNMTQSKSYSHGRIHIGLFHSLTSLSPLLPPSCILSNASLFLLMPLFHSLCHPLFLSPFFSLTIEMSSLSSMEQGITSQVVWFNTAVHSPHQTTKMFASKKKNAFVLISNYNLPLCLCVSLLFTETVFTCLRVRHK